MKSILISINPQHAVNILNGSKTLELRKSVPKDFVGWVYMYVTKGKPYYPDCSYHGVGNINGKVVARWWFDGYIKLEHYIDIYDYCFGSMQLKNMLTFVNNLKLNYDDILEYGNSKDLYAWHIKKLKIFDSPKELHHFYTYKERLIDCGMDCQPYVDEVKTTLTKAPQSWQYVWVKE
jgi:hypothetical protein